MEPVLTANLVSRRAWKRPRRRERLARKLESLVVVLLAARASAQSAPALGRP